MATIKLTDDTWLQQEANKVEGILRQALGGSTNKAGKDVATLRTMVEYAMGDDYYSDSDLVLIKNELIARGIVEIIT